MRKLLLWAAGLAIVVVAGTYAAFQLSPWPAVLLIRHGFDQGAADAAASVADKVPDSLSVRRGLSYDPGDRDALFDLFAPKDAGQPLPAVVWVHGGGFVAGSRGDLAGYLQLLAARGFVTVAIDYTTAPEAGFPTPVRQTNQALAHLTAHAADYGIDPARLFLAGDSAGAQIAAQTAQSIADPATAARLGVRPGLAPATLRGLLLYCGPYDPATMNFDGAFGGFMRTVIWAYAGTRDPGDPRVARIAVTPHVTAAFPPAFVSVGNADPLAPQSVALAERLKAVGAEVETLFFPADHQPPLGHEYQLLLSTDDARLAFERSVAFLTAHARAAP